MNYCDSEALRASRSQLALPRAHVSLIRRQELSQRLDAAIELALCLIVAPAGFGKSTLLAQWRQGFQVRDAVIALMRLHETDAQPEQFVVHLVEALTAAGLDLRALTGAVHQGATIAMPEAIASVLLLIGTFGRRVVLVLDDYHRAQSAIVDSAVNHLLERNPGNLSVIISSREQPSVITPALIAGGRAIEINAEVLRFSMAETAELLKDEAGTDRAAAIWKRSEGWPISLQLGRQAARSAGQAFTEAYCSQNRQLDCYVRDQVLGQLPADLQICAMQTAMLVEFNAELASAVTGQKYGSSILRRLLRHLNPLLIQLGGDGAWFRYHPLVAEALRNQLSEKHPHLVPQTYLWASDWMHHAGQTVEAVRYAALALDFDRCATIIEIAGGWEVILYGGTSQMRALLDVFPENMLQRYPRMIMAKAYLAINDGDLMTARSLVDAVKDEAATTRDAGCGRSGLSRDILNVSAMLQAYEGSAQRGEDLDEHMAQREAMAPTDYLARGVIECSGARHSLALGNLPRAEFLAQVAGFSMRRARSKSGLTHTYLHAGLAAFYTGRLHEAETKFSEAVQQGQIHSEDDCALGAMAQLLLGAVALLTGGWSEDLRGKFHRARNLVERFGSWPEVLAISLETAVADATQQGSLKAASAAVRVTRVIAEARNLRGLIDEADAFHLDIVARQGDQRHAQYLARALEERYSPGCWRRQPSVWRPYITVGLALARWHQERNAKKALGFADDLVECCEHVGADLSAVRAHLVRATVLEQMSCRPEALSALGQALGLASREDIVMPFLLMPNLTPLLHAANKRTRGDTSGETGGFVGHVLEKMTALHAGINVVGTGLSQRERQVACELLRVHSTKAIARSLDLTEHTVKFHLSNIFTKLNVDKRAGAIAALRRVDT